MALGNVVVIAGGIVAAEEDKRAGVQLLVERGQFAGDAEVAAFIRERVDEGGEQRGVGERVGEQVARLIAAGVAGSGNGADALRQRCENLAGLAV